MKNSSKKKIYLVSSLLGLAGMLVGGQALAYAEQKRDYSDGDSAGNNHFRASYGWWGLTRNRTETTGPIDRAVVADQMLWADLCVFGKNFRALEVQAGAFSRNTTGTSVPYEKYQAGRVILAGSTLYNAEAWNTTCPGRSAAYGCSSYSRSLSKTLFSASGSFTLVIPITVRASVVGGLHGSINMDTYSTTYLGKANSFYGRATSSFDAGAFVTSHQSASGGLPYVVEVGLGVDLTLIDLSYTPRMQAYQTVLRSGTTTTGRRGHDNYDALELHTLSGNVKVFALLFGEEIDSLNLLSWDGYSWIGEWVNDSASEAL